MSDPVTLMAEMDDLAKRLDGASRELYVKEGEFQEIDEQVSDLWDEMLVALVDDYEKEEKRPPAEDIREARVRRLLRRQHSDLYKRHRQLKSDIDRLERRAKRVERAMSSKQSQLSFLKTEAQAVG